MIMTVLEAQVPPDHTPALLDAYTAAGDKPLPPGLVRTELFARRSRCRAMANPDVVDEP